METQGFSSVEIRSSSVEIGSSSVDIGSSSVEIGSSSGRGIRLDVGESSIPITPSQRNFQRNFHLCLSYPNSFKISESMGNETLLHDAVSVCVCVCVRERERERERECVCIRETERMWMWMCE